MSERDPKRLIDPKSSASPALRALLTKLRVPEASEDDEIEVESSVNESISREGAPVVVPERKVQAS